MPLFLAPPTAARRGGAAGSLITGVIMLRAPEEREGPKGERERQSRFRSDKNMIYRRARRVADCTSGSGRIGMSHTALNGSCINAGAGKELMDREYVGNLWYKNQHIPQIFPTCSPYIVNEVPTSTF